jgi:2-keto-4-pentenoate hydratase/2-oxohepta-3-ene-1,7-dioic acid hydratase in catechol pathway
MVDARPVDPADVWRGLRYYGVRVEPEPRFIAWQDLDVPLPHRGTRCWGYALTYPEHRRETLRAAVFRFLKRGSISPNSAPIPHREFLDFELEIGLLMHRDHPDRFGYFLANDLTDRGLQVEHYDAEELEPGFTLAKEFPGSLRAGPLLVVGDSSLWPRLTASLTLNETLRQTLRAADCHLEPRRLHRELFRGHHDGPWLLAITGTPGGTLFRTPRTREKLKAIISGRLSVKRARQCWLLGLKFLRPGDRLVLESPVLGHSETVVI